MVKASPFFLYWFHVSICSILNVIHSHSILSRFKLFPHQILRLAWHTKWTKKLIHKLKELNKRAGTL